jgi:hypothetical protein
MNDSAENNTNTDSGNGNNTAVGYQALQLDTYGAVNTAIGCQALNQNTTGVGNTATGDHALYSNTNGSYNVAHGVVTLYSNSSGNYNTANGDFALYSNVDGSNNTANGAGALYLSSGVDNTADGVNALENLFDGSNNIAVGFLAGNNIDAADNNIDIGSEGDSTDTGIIRIGTPGLQTATYLAGNVYGTSFNSTSDRNAKENFTTVDARDVLARVAALPVTQWNYKTESKDVQHIGPMAQDFQAAFHLSVDDKHISVMDEGGVALAAIQGLSQKLNEKDAQIQSLQQQNDSLAGRLNELEATVRQLAARK